MQDEHVDRLARRARVTVVTVTFNSAAVLAEFAAGVNDQRTDLDIDVIIIDNASADTTMAAAERLLPEATVLTNRTNRGLSAANNQGLLLARDEFVIVANPDTRAEAGCFAALIDVARRHPRAAVVVPRLHGVDGREHVSVGAIPSVASALLGRRLGRALARGRTQKDTDLWWDDWPHDRETEVPRGAEACYLIRREAVADVGLQDERYPLDWEGIDWADRFRAAGWETWFTPLAQTAHMGGASIRQVQAHWVVQSHRGLRRYCRDRVPVLARPVIDAVVSVRALTKLALLASGRDAYARAQEALETS